MYRSVGNVKSGYLYSDVTCGYVGEVVMIKVVVVVTLVVTVVVRVMLVVVVLVTLVVLVAVVVEKSVVVARILAVTVVVAVDVVVHWSAVVVVLQCGRTVVGSIWGWLPLLPGPVSKSSSNSSCISTSNLPSFPFN